MLIASSFGPLGAVGLSTQSQISRLEALLTANGILADGRIVTNVAGVPREDLKRIGSVVSYLQNTRKLAAIEPWFSDIELDFDKWPGPVDILKAMGQEYVPEWDNPTSFNLRVDRNWGDESFDVHGFSVIARVSATRDSTVRPADIRDSSSMETYALSFRNGLFKVTGPQNTRVSFDLNALAERLRSGNSSNAPESEMTLDASDGHLRVRLAVYGLNGNLVDAVPNVTQVEGWILIGKVP